MKITMTPISERQRAKFLTYKKKKMRNVYIYIQKSRHIAKIKTICVTFFIHKEPDSLRYGIFMMFLKMALIYIQKA